MAIQHRDLCVVSCGENFVAKTRKPNGGIREAIRVRDLIGLDRAASSDSHAPRPNAKTVIIFQ